jgi:hypothetical protein
MHAILHGSLDNQAVVSLWLKHTRLMTRHTTWQLHCCLYSLVLSRKHSKPQQVQANGVLLLPHDVT